MAKVLLFGPLRDLAGWRERRIEAGDIAELKTLLAAEDARLGAALDGRGVQVALDQTILRGPARLSAESEVAFLPPMSGG